MSLHAFVEHGGGALAAVAAWLAMTAAMMTPAVAPWLRAYATFVAQAPHATAGHRPSLSTPSLSRAWPFAAGYAVVWTVFSVAMASTQAALAAGSWLVGDRLGSALGAVVLIAAGIFQFTPLKASCLTHCRNPLGFFLARWRNGPTGGFRLGLSHGAYCLGCCWALMATAFAVGVMSVVWMALLTVVVVAEQTSAGGPAIARGVGVALVVAGAWRLA
jgi:predicted metal-binding membrane protein